MCNSVSTSHVLSVELEQFVGINCSEYSEHGTVGVATRHQWFHALGYTLDDLRIHWAFPQHPNVRGLLEGRGEGMVYMYVVSVLITWQAEDTTASLRREFDQKAWKAVGGKYAHRIFGYLLPPITGTSPPHCGPIPSVTFLLSICQVFTSFKLVYLK